MHPGQILVGTAVVLALVWGVTAQQAQVAALAEPADEPPAVQYTARVILPEAEVRALPSTSPESYTTGKLRRDEIVRVVGTKEGGWLAIMPPSGSFSWINNRFLQPDNGKVRRVVADAPVPVLCGSKLRDQKPTVISAEVKRGTQVVSVGKPIASDDGLWMPIEPTLREIRYVRSEAVQPITPSAPTNPPTAGTTLSVPSPTATATANSASFSVTGNDPASQSLWQQAQQAEQQNNRDEAIRLYEQLGNAVRNTDDGLSMQAYSRASYLRGLGRSAATRPAGQPNPIPAPNERLQPLPTSLRAAAGPAPCVPCQTTSSSPGTIYRSWPGKLRPSARQLGGPTFALEDRQGQLLMYVTAQPGVSLEPYLNRVVELVGPMSYRGELRTYHLQAAQVASVK